MKKVLFVAHVDSHIRHFHIPYMKYFHDNGYEVHVATSDDEKEQFTYCDKKHKVTMERSPFKINNLKAINQMAELIKNEKFDIITCHTPMGGVVTRLAVRKLRRSGALCAPQSNNDIWSPQSMQVIYTAHGFHFFKGAPTLNWLLYYPMEKWLAKYTDKLITINEEDYNMAVTKKFKAEKIYKIDGIGVDPSKFSFHMPEDDKKRLKRELSSINDEFKINKNDVVVTYVAELIKRKNQDLIIDVLASINRGTNLATEIDSSSRGDHCSPEKDSSSRGDHWSPEKDSSNKKDIESNLLSNIKVLLVGTGVLKDYYEKRIKSLGLEQNILLTGYRKDVPQILKITDIAISCAKHEGLPFNLVEAQMSGLPCVATDCRGNNEVIEENKTGYLISDFNKDKFQNKLLKLVNSETMRERMGKNALENSKKYKLSRVLDEMKKIYEE